MDYKIIFSILGYICYALAALMAVPAAAAAYYGESLPEMLFSLLAACLCGYWLRGRGAGLYDGVGLREGISGVVFGWLLAAFLGAFPYMAAGVLWPAEAFFESMSGFTTTGATVITAIDGLPRYLLLWRSMTNWIGGLAIISLFIAVLPQLAKGSAYLFNSEVEGNAGGRILPRIRSTAVAVFYIYVLLTIILTGCLVVLGMTEFDALNYALTTISTGGFAPHSNSVAQLQSVGVELVLALFMILAGGNFALYYHMTQSSVRVFYDNLEFKLYIGAILLATLAIMLDLVAAGGYGAGEGLRHAFFQAASFCTTTGFASCNYDLWPAFAKLVMAFLFVMGGCSGSTAGGVKVSRFIVLVKSVFTELRRTLHPRMVFSVSYQGRQLPQSTIAYVSRFFFIYIFIGAALVLGVTASGLPLDDAVFGVFACLASVGPAFGSLGVASTFAEVPLLGKLVFALAMLAGRVELVLALVLLRREYWRSSKNW